MTVHRRRYCRTWAKTGCLACGIVMQGTVHVLELCQLAASQLLHCAACRPPLPQDRVVLMTGELAPVKAACALVLHIIHDIQGRDRESAVPAPLDLGQDRDSLEITQRLLIPATAGGLVIGRGGGHIKVCICVMLGSPFVLFTRAECHADYVEPPSRDNGTDRHQLHTYIGGAPEQTHVCSNSAQIARTLAAVFAQCARHCHILAPSKPMSQACSCLTRTLCTAHMALRM
jgi:hypothetical protein